MHSRCKNKQNKRVFLVAENIVGSLWFFCVTSFGVCTHPKHQETTKQTKTIIKTKTRSHAKTNASLADIFSFSPQYGARSQATKLVNASPNHFDPCLPRNLKVANRKPQKTVRFWKRLKISFQSCELSVKWTLVSCVSYLWLLVTSTDLVRKQRLKF